MKILKLPLLFVLLLTVFISCKPEEETPPQTPPASTTNANPTPTFTEADGVLASIQTLTYQSVAGFETAIPADVAVAFFSKTSNTYYDAGLVSVNSKDLEKHSNNSYTSVSGNSLTLDLGFGSNGNKWSVAGSTDIPSFTHTTSRGMPSDIKFKSEITNVNTANDLTVSIKSAPSVCDSLLYVVGGEGKEVLTKTVSNTTTSVDFSASELNGFTGTGLIQVVAYNFEFSLENNKKMYYVNEKVITNQVSFE